MTKPFDSGELMARVRALTRRRGEILGDELETGDLRLDCTSRELCCKSRSVRLSFKEFETMRLLMSSAPAVVTKEGLITRVWGIESEAEDNNVEVYISFCAKSSAIWQFRGDRNGAQGGVCAGAHGKMRIRRYAA
jgi:DNA-binding response OmpR family regulator